MSGAASGVLTQTLSDVESDAMAPGTYKYDIQVFTAGDGYYTPLLGEEIVIVADYTRRKTTP